MLRIFKKEMRAYLLNPLGYIYLTIFFVITALLFIVANVRGSSTLFEVVIVNLRTALMIFVPAIIMKLLVEERRSKTEQLLFTAPITVSSIVIGKFLAATAMLVITMIITLVYPIMLSFVTTLYIPSLITSYIGFLLLGMALIAVCLFLSSFTENTVISFLVGVGSIFFIWIGERGVGRIGNKYIAEFVDAFCMMGKLANFTRGYLDIAVVFYYITIIVTFVFLTIRQIEKRRIG